MKVHRNAIFFMIVEENSISQNGEFVALQKLLEKRAEKVNFFFPYAFLNYLK